MKLLPRTVVKFGGPRRFMIGDGLGMLEGPAVFEIGCDAGGAKRVAAGRVGQGGGLGSALDHMEYVESGHGFFAEPLALTHAAEQGALLVTGNTRRLDPGCQVSLQLGMAGHFVTLAAFLVQPQPQPLAVLKEVATFHRYCRTDP